MSAGPAPSELGPVDLAGRRPAFGPAEAEALGRRLFGVEGAARELASERDQNFRLDGPGGIFVLKIAQAGEDPAVLDLQAEALAAAARRAPSVRVPRLVPPRAGGGVCEVEGPRGERHLVRLLTWVPGTPLAEVRPHSRELLVDVGRALGALDGALAELDHPAQDRSLRWDLRHADDVIAAFAGAIADGRRRALVDQRREAFRERVVPAAPDLRLALVHHDANDHNVLVEEGPGRQRVAGLIDFGDMVRSFAASEVAVACAYAMLGKRDPVGAACAVVAGYQEERPLVEDELDVLPELIGARLATSVAISAHQGRQEPGLGYLSVSEEPAWTLLEELERIPAGLFRARLRHAAGYAPTRGRAAVLDWLEREGAGAGPVLDRDVRGACVLDLGVASPLVEPGDGLAELERELAAARERTGAEVIVGRYGEARLLYSTELFRYATEDRDAQRSVHLGLDLFVPAGEAVRAPLDGTVVACRDNAGELDYGPTVVLRHEPEPGTVFYSLYGHLDPSCLAELTENDALARGDRIGAVGAPPRNGGWAPHLHLQLALDLLGFGAGLPGVAAPEERALWLELCPDPNFLVGVPAAAFPRPERTAAELRDGRRAKLCAAQGLSYRRPLHLVRGRAQQLFDADGRSYLDAVNNVPHVGHGHPRVVRAGARQMAVLNTNTRYLHEGVVRYAERLTAIFPAPLEVCFFTCSGSEANELALRLARASTGGTDFVVLDGAYHGNTQALVDLSPYKHAGPGGGGRPEHVRVAAMPDPYRGPFGASDPEAGPRCADDVRRALAEIAAAGRRPAAFLAEPLLGCGGQIVPPPGYLAAAYGHARAAGAVCIADEVQTGFGRVGAHWWAFEAQGVVPDVVTLGKPIANGHPMGAVVTTRAIAEAFTTGMEYFNTFGGNPVSCAMAEAVLDVIEEEGLRGRARAVGGRLAEELRGLARRHALIGEVRGLGLFLGVELVLDRVLKTPAPQHAGHAVERMKDKGVLLSTDGPLHNVLKIKPPLCFTEDDADRLCAALDEVLAETALAPPEPGETP